MQWLSSSPIQALTLTFLLLPPLNPNLTAPSFSRVLIFFLFPPPPVHFSSSWLPRIFLLIFAFCWSCFVSLDVSSVFLSLSLSLLHTYTHPRQPLSTGCQILIWASWTQTTVYPLVSNGKVLKTPFIRSVWSYILYVHYSSQITPLDWLTPAIRKSIAECVCVKSFLSS